jgi:membrane protease YdiL (CAAX protease family)
MSTAAFPARPARPFAAWLGLALALVFPTIITWVYFYQAGHSDQGVQRAVMGTLKFIQFAFPIAWIYLVLRERIHWQRLGSKGVVAGVLFGIAVAFGGWLVFHFALQSTPAFQAALGPIRAKIAGFGLDSVPKFVALGAFYSLAHSLMEEYYWRWFVFGQLRRLLPLWPAVIVSAVGFTAHHVLVLAWYFGWSSWLTLLFSSSVAIGGGFWAWLYDRSGSILGPWLSHLVIDAAIFYIGFQILRTTLV